MEKNGRVMQMHSIVSFDINSIEQAKKHKFTGTASQTGFIRERVKVPVKDGRSQGVSEHENCDDQGVGILERNL